MLLPTSCLIFIKKIDFLIKSHKEILDKNSMQMSLIHALDSKFMETSEPSIPLVENEKGGMVYEHVAPTTEFGNKHGIALLELFAKELVRGKKPDIISAMKQETPEAKIYGILLAFYARSIKNGVGERDIFYHMYGKLLLEYPITMKHILPLICQESIAGSWNDFERILDYFATTHDNTDELFKYREDLREMVVNLFVEQLMQDAQRLQENPEANISLAGKYTPTEGTKYWLSLGKFIAIKISKLQNQSEMPAKTAFKDYRKMVSTLRKHLSIVESLMCTKKWEEIDFSRVPSGAMRIYGKYAFKNEKKDGNTVTTRSEEIARIELAIRFTEYLQKAKTGEAKIHGGRLQVHQLPKMLKSGGDEVEAQVKDLLETLKKEMAFKAKEEDIALNLSKVIVMVDTSGSMNTVVAPGVTAMDISTILGLLISQMVLPPWNDRVMTFTSYPIWVNLSGESTFTKKYDKILKAPWGANTNFERAYKLILDTIMEKKMPVEDMEGLTILVVSDMQFDEASAKNLPHFELIAKQFHDLGMSIHNTPYPMPHMVFWNLAARPTNGFVATSDTPNVTLLSGFGLAQLKNILAGKNLVTSPLEKMFEVFNAPCFRRLRQMIANIQVEAQEFLVPDGFADGTFMTNTEPDDISEFVDAYLEEHAN